MTCCPYHEPVTGDWVATTLQAALKTYLVLSRLRDRHPRHVGDAHVDRE